MNKIKVMTVFGTRPEAIKMAPLVHALEQNENTESIVCVTAQHREMLDQVLDIFDIKPDYDLNIMQPRQTLATITEKSLHGLDEVLERHSRISCLSTVIPRLPLPVRLRHSTTRCRSVM